VQKKKKTGFNPAFAATNRLQTYT